MIPFPILSSTAIPTAVKIKKVAAGAEHFAFLSDEGDVYTVGTNTYGQCGTGDMSLVTKPRKVLSGVKDIFCGEKCTFVILTDYTVLISGSTLCIGLNSTVSTFSLRSSINDQKARVPVKICASERLCGIMYADATLYTCGTGYLGNGSYTSGNQISMLQVATNCYDVSVSTESIYYRDNNQNLWGVGEMWALNLPTTSNNQASWAVQYGGLYRPVMQPELKTHFRCCIFPDTNSTYCVGIASYGQLGNGVITDVQGNRVYPRTSYLSGIDYCYSSARGLAYNSMVARDDGIYFSGKTTNSNSGFPTIGGNVGTYRAIPLEAMLAGRVYDPTLVKYIETNLNCTYILYGDDLYCTGLRYDDTFSTVFMPVTIKA